MTEPLKGKDSATPIIEIKGLEKEYGNQRVLRGIQLSISAGQHCFLIGANGSGKTTFIQILAGLLSPTKGSVVINGATFSKAGHIIRQKIFLLSHDTFFYLNYTAKENLNFFYRLLSANHPQYASLPKRERHNMIEQALHKVSLYYDRNKKIEELSLGMRHRLSIARLYMFQPEIILMDEPNTGLDLQGEILLDNIIEERINTGATVVEATHRMNKIKDLLEQKIKDAQNKRVIQFQKGTISFDSHFNESASFLLKKV